MDILLLQCLLLALAMLAGYEISYRVSLWSIRAGERWGIVSHVTDRSSHAAPTSRLGGIGLVLGFLIPSVLFAAASWFLPHREFSWGGNPSLMAMMLAGALAIFCVGLADDVWSLPAPIKLAAQMLALFPLTASGLRFLTLDGVNVPGLFPAAVPTLAAMAWVVFLLNAYNFMDGMDGFAARFTMHVCLWLFPLVLLKSIIMGKLLDVRLELMFVPILSAACSGFYRVNRPPALVFMGDGGSLTLGYFLALLLVLADGGYFVANYRAPRLGEAVPAMSVFILLWPFVFDVVLTILRRLRRGENLFAAHREHLYQRLMITGMSHRDVLMLNMRYFRICGVLALAYSFAPYLIARAAILAAALLAMAHYWRYVLKRERGTLKSD